MFSVYRVYHASDVTALCFIFLLAIWGGCKLSSIWEACFQPNTIQETISADCFGCLCKTCKQKLTGRDVELLHDCRTRKLICKKSNICFFWNFRYLNFYRWILDVCRKVRVKKLNSMIFLKWGQGVYVDHLSKYVMLHNVVGVSWGKKMSYQSPPPISPRGIDQILWYQVNLIISRRETIFWNFFFRALLPFFWRFSQIENQFVISTHWKFSGLLTSEYFCILAELGRDYLPLMTPILFS